jgi:tryptophanyl-tRNA synthetase
VPQATIEMAADWLGAGLDPERSTLFIQSMVPEHAELHLLFSMVTPVGWLERVPTYKERIEQQGSPRRRTACWVIRCCSRRTSSCTRPLGAGGHRPGAAHRAHARGRAALQYAFGACSRSRKPS